MHPVWSFFIFYDRNSSVVRSSVLAKFPVFVLEKKVEF